MSLVVASSVLDTIWTEFSTVDYTASTLGTLSAMIDEVGLKINRGAISASSYPSDTQVAQWLVRGKQEFAKTKSFTWRRRYATTTTTASVYRYSMPPDYDGGTAIIKDMTNDTNIKVISNSRYDDLFPDPSEESGSQPVVATIEGARHGIENCNARATARLARSAATQFLERDHGHAQCIATPDRLCSWYMSPCSRGPLAPPQLEHRLKRRTVSLRRCQ